MIEPRREDVERGTSALLPFVRDWNVALNPEDLELVPVVVGQSEQDALAAIKGAGLQPEVTYRRIRTARRGMTGRVISQGPIARITSKGQPVPLVVAVATPRPD